MDNNLFNISCTLLDSAKSGIWHLFHYGMNVIVCAS